MAKINTSLIFCNTYYDDSGDQYTNNLQSKSKDYGLPYINDEHSYTSMSATYVNMFITK